MVVSVGTDYAPGAAGGYRKFTSKVGPGVHYTVIRNPKGPWRIQITSVALDARSTLDVELAHNQLGGARERTSSMARRHGAIAAINADFGWHRPMHVYAEDGHLVQTPPNWGANFMVDRTETSAYFRRRPSLEVSIEPLAGPAEGDVSVDRVNSGRPGARQVSLFSPIGGTLEEPPANACSARLLPLERPRLLARGTGVRAAHKVVLSRCSSEAMARGNGKVVATPRRGHRQSEVVGLRPGELVGLSWSFGGIGAFDSVGGYPLLMKDGAIQWDYLTGDRPFYGRHPRTGVGYDSDAGTVLFVTVDGRRPGYSVGMTLPRFAQLFKSLGADSALNLDGGGSTTMWVRGDVKNRPSDGAERAVTTALLVLPRGDAEEVSRNAELGPVVAGAPGRQSLTALPPALASDPASSAGLTDALRDRGFRLPVETGMQLLNEPAPPR
jgi:hypothetical protein